LENPRLWWTHDLAEPNLYTVKVETFGDELLRTRLDTWEFEWGLRRFEMHDWIPYLNGHRLFLKGNNYAPGDTRIATMTRERYLHDLTMARDANMNFMRIHAHVEKPELYDVADELGILLWQDFPLQWSGTRRDRCCAVRANGRCRGVLTPTRTFTSAGTRHPKDRSAALRRSHDSTRALCNSSPNSARSRFPIVSRRASSWRPTLAR